MSSLQVISALEQFQSQVGNFEKTVTKLIQAKKTMSTEHAQTQSQAQSINNRLQQTPVAIVGIASIFPQASNLQEYWENILQEVDCITEVPSSRWNIEDYYNPDPSVADKTYSKRGGFIPDIDFNPMEFGLPPNLLEVTDISQLLSLVVAKQALEDSGYGESSKFDRDQTGITLGVATGRQLATPLSTRLQYPIWERVLKHSGLSETETQTIIEKIKSAYVEWNENAFPGLLGNVVAGRIANRLDLGGINCTVDAACASSLAAFKMAISELTEYRSNLMVTGGVDTDNSILTYLCFSKTPALSKTQQSRPFDASSDGILLGEGIGMVVLKRLEDARKDGDRIYATIRGIGTSSDGRFKSIYAPRAEGQVKALQRAYQNAGFEPASIGLIEAHGTGTVAGDTTEFEALKQFFGEHEVERQSIALGSVKSQIGHTKAAAGAASIIKVALALHHKILPPTINVENPNPKLDLDRSPFYLNTKARPWLRSPEKGPRRAGVSSFGFGGTNFHVLLEEDTGDQGCSTPILSANPYRLHRTSESIALFSSSSAQLLRECRATLKKLQSETGQASYLALVETSKSAQIPEASARIGFIADSLAETCHKLSTAIAWFEKQPQLPEWEHPKGIYYRATGLNLQGKVVALFSGQGPQYLEMGRELVMNFPELQQTYDVADRLHLRQEKNQQEKHPISEIVFPPPTFREEVRTAQVERLRRTENAQPAIGAFSTGLFKILEQAGFRADFAAGHSFGELTALWAAKVLDDEDYFALVNARGKAMAVSPQNTDSGAMLAVKMSLGQVESMIRKFPQVVIANVNSPQQVVLAGARSAIENLQQHLQSQDIMATLLPVAAAFHTPFVAYAQKPFAHALQAVSFNSPQIPVYSNMTGQRYPDEPAEIQKNLKDHLLNPVQFKQEIENIYAQGGYCFVEFGPKATLTNLVKEILGDAPHIAVALNASAQQDSDRQFREAVLQLRVAGIALNCIDTYPLTPPAQVETSKAMNVRLCASNYVAEKTKNAFEQALSNGHAPKAPSFEQQEQPSEVSIASALADAAVLSEAPEALTPSVALAPSPSADSVLPSTLPVSDRPRQEASLSVNPLSNLAVLTPNQSTPETELQIMAHSSLNHSHLFQSLDESLKQMNQHQSETLQVHAQYLGHQMEYAKIFFHLVQQQSKLFADSASENPGADLSTQLAVMQSLERNLAYLHEHQTQTLQLHGRSLEHQTEHSRNLFHLAQQHYRLLSEDETLLLHEEPFNEDLSLLSQAREHPSTHEEEAIPTAVPKISPAMVRPLDTAAPTAAPPTVEPIESSNRNSHSFTKAPAPQPPRAGVQSEAVTPTAAEFTNPAIEPKPTPSIAASSAIPAVAIDLAELQQVLLTIVSEKTGYPVEMLELEMDMEADLGIDSIKRVEILGALQERFPSEAQPNLEDLAELRTLTQIAAYMTQLSATLPQAKANPISESIQENRVLEMASSHSARYSNGNGNGNGSNGNGNGSKYGTSTAATTASNGSHDKGSRNGSSTASADDWCEAIAPSFDELLSSANSLPELDQVNSLNSLGNSRAPDSPSHLSADEALDLESLGQSLLEIVSEKTGYPVEMLELEMDMEADLGIDSIKRVEILGAMQERFQSLPQPNLEDLAELRTLGQIVNFLGVDFLGQEIAEKKKPQLIASPPS
jgi:acyl transferase domain-containing protein